MLKDVRTNYQKYELDENSVRKNPFEQLNLWLNDALESHVPDPTAMVLSTIDQDGYPDSRIVLLKEVTAEGLVFFTNYSSAKGKQLQAQNQVSVVFFWPKFERQIRIKGITEKISEEDSEAYFLSRPIESQIGAWASPQSQVIAGRQVLDDHFSYYKKYFQQHEMKKPTQWGGFLIHPVRFEFWQGRSNRLHDRIEFQLNEGNWQIRRLAP
jgi:pyridoxamine 5'-phosphate oxidase